jgi:hypothetical protein
MFWIRSARRAEWSRKLECFVECLEMFLVLPRFPAEMDRWGRHDRVPLMPGREDLEEEDAFEDL